ncbi:hypothetical protein GCM10023194_28990 [Planotetraspora phitsanulokensis]|uniref:DUF1918 domain-containing protein n=1 Tax=Planotetraspora phitsanulokensis TaxID=575192 RepID=A0A8J3TZP0_9ACTN|nr:DUF1918 domain-containing protein [Planotetraspora phitsanulokensis]GII35963.1 hypothetical protein Pph01_09660 [Planotetraspora phitsanulokensis]
MRAAVGDRLIIESPPSGGAPRTGVITALYHSDGSPPYVVHWLDEAHETMFFPGPDAHIKHVDERDRFAVSPLPYLGRARRIDADR